jgi:hypothetical protein
LPEKRRAPALVFTGKPSVDNIPTMKVDASAVQV